MDGPIRLWRSSLRLRLTVAATALAALILAICGSAAVEVYHNSLVGSVWRTVDATAGEIAKQVGSEPRLPHPIPMPVSSGVPRVQILDGANHVITGDPASAGLPPMYALPPGVSSRQAVIGHPAFPGADSAAVDAVRVRTRQGWETVMAALSLDPAGARIREAAWLIAGLAAAALALVAAVSWLTAGWALRPVERLRGQAATIAASGDLSGRLADLGTDELARLGGTLNDMLDSLKLSADRQRRFVADAAHELRTPLAGLIAALEVAQAHPDTSPALVEELLTGHRRLGRLVNDLLILAAVDERAPRRTELVNLAGVVTDCSRRPAPPGVSIRIACLDRVLVLGDEAQLSRVVSNLVDNALRYAATSVELSVRADGGEAVIRVCDDGPGIPPADRERIWERFTRLDDGRSRKSGASGLGLAMVRDLTAAHGGTAAVTSRPTGPGALFEVRLPALTA
jgi:signal transduction histidine kinase